MKTEAFQNSTEKASYTLVSVYQRLIFGRFIVDDSENVSKRMRFTIRWKWRAGVSSEKKKTNIKRPNGPYLTSFAMYIYNSAVPPFVTVHPESKIRMPGQSVTFCCEGEGNPPPEIEW